ncbi:MAG TPA: TetR/AcrR family transcriptional regulator [Cyclobacteriaceae bacterium]
MNKAARTRQHILERTAPVFNRKGYSGTSLNDLTRATGLTKGALYGHFRSKEDLALQAFRHAMQLVRTGVRGSLAHKRSSRERLLGLLEFYAAYVLDPPLPGGCPLLNTAVQADDDITFMRRAVRKELDATVDFVQHLLEEGIASGEFRPVADTRALAFVFFCSVEGAVMYARAVRSTEAMTYITEYCRQIIDQISK